MSRPRTELLDFAAIIGQLKSKQVWEYQACTRIGCPDVPQQAFNSLQQPVDFPPVESAIVAGDRVALAVDPNVPDLVQVIHGTMKALGATGARKIDIVLWDEASNETLAEVQQSVGDSAQVSRHESSIRESLRYLAADEAADPIYLNRRLVDADFVLPIVAGRPRDTGCKHDFTGVFPAYSDSASRERHRAQNAEKLAEPSSESPYLPETAWLLGVHIMMCVTANAEGLVGEIQAGTPDAVRKQLTPPQQAPDDFPPRAALVVASLDGGLQQQTWCNAARAAAAASQYVQPGGTIVLWTEIDAPPKPTMLSTSDHSAADPEVLSPSDDFPRWDASVDSSRTLDRIASEYRLLIHAKLNEEAIEGMGVGSIATVEELIRLSQSFDDCGVLRAAQFAGTTNDTPSLATRPAS